MPEIMQTDLSEVKMDLWVRRVASFFPMLIAFTMPMPVKLNSVCILLNIFVFLVIGIKYKILDFGFTKTGLFRAMAWLFLILVIGLIHTEDLRLGKFEIEKNFTLLVFPFLIYQWKTFHVKVEKLLWAFIIGCVLVTCYGFFYCYFLLEGELRAYAFDLGHSYYTRFISIHPTYLAVYFAVIFFYLLQFYGARTQKMNAWSKVGIVSLLAYSVFMLLFLRSRIALFTWCLLLVIYLLRGRSRSAQVIVTSALILLLLLLSFDNTYFSSIDYWSRNTSDALQERFGVWNGAWEGARMSPFIGAGTGSAQCLIDEGYLKTGFDWGLDYEYNAHNQFLQFLCQNGIVELLSFLVLLFILFRSSLNRKNVTFFMFVLLTCFAMVTESILYVQKGIIFFYFFSCAFYYLDHE